MSQRRKPSSTHAVLKVLDLEFKIPIGRLHSFSVSRCNNRVEIVHRYRGEQETYAVVELPNGL